MASFFTKRFQSFKHAFNGFYALRKETHIIIHILISLATIILGFYQKISKIEWLIIILCIGLVFVAEIMNTAIEKTVDYISLEHNSKAKIIKDISAGGVLFAAIISAFIGSLILFF